MGLHHWGDRLAVYNVSNVNPSPRVDKPDLIHVQIPTSIYQDELYDATVNVEITSESGQVSLDKFDGNLLSLNSFQKFIS